MKTYYLKCRMSQDSEWKSSNYGSTEEEILKVAEQKSKTWRYITVVQYSNDSTSEVIYKG